MTKNGKIKGDEFIMKFSIFNYNKITGDKIIIFNTLTRAIILLDRIEYKMIKEVIKNNSSEKIEKRYEELISNGIIVEDEVDEFLTFKYWMNKAKYQNKTLTITLLTTYRCNFNCKYCFEGSRKSEEGKIEIGEMISFLENLITKLKPKFIDFNFFGGEPLLEIDILKIICEFLNEVEEKFSTKKSINIITNGYLINSQLISELRELKVNSFQITIDGNENAHDKRRVLYNGSGTFKIVYNNTLKLIENGFEVVINMNFDNSNYKSIIEFLEKFPRNLRNRVYIKFSPIIVTKNNRDNIDLENERGKAKIHKMLLKKLREYDYQMDINFMEYQPCLANRAYSVIIASDGNLSKCIYGVGDERFIISNVKKDINKILFDLFLSCEEEVNYKKECKSVLFTFMCRWMQKTKGRRRNSTI